MMRIAFVCPDAMAVFDPASGRRHGGAEVRAATFARGLAREPGVNVTVVVGTDGAREERIVDGITLVCEPSLGSVNAPLFLRPMILRLLQDVSAKPGFPWVRVHRWSFPLLWRLPVATIVRLSNIVRDRLRPAVRVRPEFTRLKADLVCAFGVSQASSDLVASARESGARSVFFSAADYDFSDVYDENSTATDMYGVPGGVGFFAMKQADRVVVQTEAQLALVKKKCGRDAAMIRNPIDIREATHAVPPGMPPKYVLWVGRSDRLHKRPMAALEVARRLPDISVVMILNRADLAIYDEVVRGCPPNVKIIERVPYDQIDAYFQHAALFLSTSVFEGFPNTFLQSGKFGVPVVSLDVDPDGFFAEHRCGLFAHGSMVQLADSIRLLWNDDARRAGYSAAIRQYVRDYHEAGARVRELRAVLQGILEKEKSPQPIKKDGPG